DHRAPRQRVRSPGRVRLHRRQRGRDDGGNVAGLGTPGVVHPAHRDPVAAAAPVSAFRSRSFLAVLVVAVALVFVPVLKLPAFYETFLDVVFLWIALATSWNILSGYAGYFSFGHAAFFGAGVYTTATLTTKLGAPFLWTLPAAGLVAAIFGVAVAAVVFRVHGVRGELFALLTLAVAFGLAAIALNAKIDGGPGVFLAAVPIPALFGAPAATLYVLSLAVAVLAVTAAFVIARSRWGTGLFAIRDDEDVAEVLGVPTYRFKLFAFGLPCFIAGLTGRIHATSVSYVTVDETFAVGLATDAIMMAALGGTRYWWGPALGALVITSLTQALTGGQSAVLNRALIGGILILVIVFLPDGVAGGPEPRGRPPRVGRPLPPRGTARRAPS